MKPTNPIRKGSGTHTFAGKIHCIILSCGHYRGEFTFHETPTQVLDYWHGTITIKTPTKEEHRRCLIEWHAWDPSLPESFWKAITNDLAVPKLPLDDRFTPDLVDIIAQRLLFVFEQRPDHTIEDDRGINLHQIDTTLFLPCLQARGLVRKDAA